MINHLQLSSQSNIDLFQKVNKILATFTTSSSLEKIKSKLASNYISSPWNVKLVKITLTVRERITVGMAVPQFDKVGFDRKRKYVIISL